MILRRIILPATLPYIMAGIRLAVGRAVVAMVIAEFFTTISGLGAMIINSANNFDTATMFVPIIILMLMAVGLNSLIGVVERRSRPGRRRSPGGSGSNSSVVPAKAGTRSCSKGGFPLARERRIKPPPAPPRSTRAPALPKYSG